MKSPKRKELVINLIVNDLINTKLISGLQTLGVDASSYYLYLSNLIFELMGMNEHTQTDELYELYNTLGSKALLIDFEGNANKALEPLAQEIYTALVKLGA